MSQSFNYSEYIDQLNNAKDIDDCPKVPIPQINDNQNYLFISYSHIDYKEVYSDLAKLYKEDVRFWYDSGLHPGKKWEEEVRQHIQDPNCSGVIFYLSKDMFLSDAISKEIGFVQSVTGRKRSKFLKNYFCVNLSKDSISKMLDAANQDRKAKGLGVLNTEIQNRLTSMFSDDATYIKYASRDHDKVLINHIKEQFDVVGDTSRIKRIWRCIKKIQSGCLGYCMFCYSRRICFTCCGHSYDKQ